MYNVEYRITCKKAQKTVRSYCYLSVVVCIVRKDFVGNIWRFQINDLSLQAITDN